MSVHLIFEFLTAFVGTIAFALLFQVPKEYYVNCGLAGGCGWICYKLLLAGCGLFGSTFFATVLVVFEFPQKWFRWAERGTAAGN